MPRFVVALLFLAAAATNARAQQPNPSPTGGKVAEAKIPLDSIYSTNGQKGLKPMPASYVEKGQEKQYQEPYGYQLEQIHREFQSGLSNVFLVRGKNITQAVTAARFAFGGGRSGETAVVEDREAANAQLWAVAFFGVAGSESPVWLIESATVRNGNLVEITYRKDPEGGETRDIHQYLAWIPLGTTAQGGYTLRLIDANSKRVTLERQCTATKK